MLKPISLVLCIFFAFSACEKDDFCTTETLTPKLILRFYDSSNPTELKAVENLSVWATDKDTLASYTSVTTDSIAIPLNTSSTSTEYHFKMNNTTGNSADNLYNQLTITYTLEDIYISRSCGFVSNFHNLSIDGETNWIQTISPTTGLTITNETAAHVQIHH